MTSIPLTLSRYLARQYLLTLFYMLGVLLALIYLLDLIELLRRASKYNDVPFSIILQMGLFKLPEVGQVILPFAILFSGMLTFWSLTKRYELVVIRAAGMSVWQFLSPVLMVAFLCGVVQTTAINPLSAMLLGTFSQYENKYLGSQKNLVTVFEDGFWIRERESIAGEVILSAEKINPETWRLENIMGLAFAEDGSLVSRLDAARALLTDGAWVFEDVHITQKGLPDQIRAAFSFPTKLTRRDIEESFAPPETISFWKIPSFVKTLETTGFDSTRLQTHFYYLLSLPLFFMAMILLAAVVSFRPPRSGYTIIMVMAGVALGIVIFFVSNYLQALGGSGRMTPWMAATAPAMITFLLGLSMLIALEDG